MNSPTEDEKDYLDRLTDIIPWHRSLTNSERILIVGLVSAFVSIVGCLLLCLIYSQSPLRRRYSMRKSGVREELIGEARKDRLILPSTPKYESVIKLEKVAPSQWNSYRNSLRASSYGNTSDSDGVLSNGYGNHPTMLNGRTKSFHSYHLPISNGRSSPSPQVSLALTMEPSENKLSIHLNQLEYLAPHPIFDEQSEYFLRVQLFSSKVLKKLYDLGKKRRTSLPLSFWKSREQQTTKPLARTSDGTWKCDEDLQFELIKAEMTSMSMRCLLFCTDRSGLHDFMFESDLRFQSSMFPSHRQIIEFHEMPHIIFGELFLGIGYLPTAERITIQMNQFHSLYKLEKDHPIHATITVTFFHQGRRFYQEKLPTINLEQNIGSSNEFSDIKDTIVQNIPLVDLPSICVHFELIVVDSSDSSQLFTSSFLLGRSTRYEAEWQKILEQPRQFHQCWYQFFG